MDVIKIGNYIAEKRKKKNMTQQELADILHLSNRTISKWECGKGIPDSSIMLELCKTLDISMNELLSGEDISPEEYRTKADENLITLMKEPEKRRNNKFLSILFGLFSEILLIIIIIICMIANGAGNNPFIDYIDLTAMISVFGVTIIMLFITGLYKYFFLSIKLSFHFCDDISSEEIDKCIHSIKLAMLSAFISGLVLSVSSVMNTYLNTSADNIGAVGVALSIGMLGILYGGIVVILLIPILGRIYIYK